MIYAVDIVGPNGGKATKEYEALSIRAAVRMAELELRSYPKCQITDIRLQGTGTCMRNVMIGKGLRV
jgi:hypothetical protein